MDGESGLVIGRSQSQRKRSYMDFLLDVEEQESSDQEFKETHKELIPPQNKMRHFGMFLQKMVCASSSLSQLMDSMMSTAGDPRGNRLHRTSDPEELRLVLLGTLGCGKTASADTILGNVAPASPSSFGSSSRICHKREGVVDGRKVTVVEAPRWYWNGRQVEDGVRRESQRALELAAPGPHAFLLLIPVCQFTEVEGRVPVEMKTVFGPDVLKHTLVLLTCGDYLAGQTEELYLRGEDPGMREVISRCGGRYHIINNRQRHDRQQVRSLLDKVEIMVAMNGGQYYMPRAKPPQDNRLESSITSSSASVQLNEDPQRIGSVRNQSSPKTSPTFSSSQSSLSYSPSLAPSSSLISPPLPSPNSTSSASELRLVLLGISGAGKSAAGNCILGKEEFESRPNSLVPVTQQCEKRRALVSGRKVSVIDTPDWFHSECSPDEVRAQISSCVALSSPGPHAFLLCVPLDRPARSELRTLDVLETVFGVAAVRRHTLLLFTHADQLRANGELVEDRNIEGYISNEREDLLKLVEKCGDRFHVLKRGGSGPERDSVDELLGKVEQTVREAGGGCYSCPAFQEAEERVRQRQREIAHERKGSGVGRVDSWTGYGSMQTLSEVDEDREEDEDDTRDEAERMVGSMRLESLPLITASTLSPSTWSSMREMMESTAKWIPTMLADSSVWVGDGVTKVAQSQMWENVGNGAKDVHKILADSSMWAKVKAGAGGVSQPIVNSALWENIGANKVPELMSGSSSAVRSRAKMVTDSPVWGQVGTGAKSGAKLVSDGSIWVGSGAKSFAQSPVWGQVGSGAKSGAKMMAGGSVRVGTGLGAGVKKVAQSPVWGKMGAGAKAGVKRVAESPIWEKMLAEAKKVPMVVAGGAFLGLLLGVVLGGVLGGAIGAATGSVISEVGRRKLSKDGNSVQVHNEGMRCNMSEAEQSFMQSGGQLFKAE
ncbi:hypothetical protein NHX12_018845 [Muraenolepis orangiensis]|uniref:GTPase IMAP family member 8 n=1 Tax=Muraenolepis orangiensis TaxID=630683 RepID=A0A9Q0EXA6_9TELE|nr:hypothetical protein NHX12_018845 [Muraenolepis orangiensis]